MMSDQNAGFASRTCAFFTDLVIINFVLLLVVAASGTVLRYFNFDNIFNIGEEPTTLGRTIVSLIGSVTFLVVYFGYPTFFWVIVGETPGKRLFGLRVLRTDGHRLGVGRALLRAAGYWISALPLFLGFIWILFDGRRQGWHDKLAGTYVIYYRPKGRRPGLSGR
jgi:uncharacterized RDD family membrane protein YckC